MEKVKPKKKHLLAIIMSIIAVAISIYICISFAYVPGEDVTLNHAGGVLGINRDIDNVYCANYDVDNDHTDIPGKYAGEVTFREDGVYINDANIGWSPDLLKLAWVVQNAGGLSDGGRNQVLGAYTGKFSQTQLLFWKYLRVLDGQFNIGFARQNQTNPGTNDYLTDIENFSREAVPGEPNVDLYTSNSTEVGVNENLVYGGEEYVRFGPFEVYMENGGQITDYQVIFENGTILPSENRKFLRMDGSEIGGDEVGNRTAFYIIVKKSAITSSIKEIKITSKRDYKYFSQPAKLEIFMSSCGNCQHIIKARPGVVDIRSSVKEDTQPINYKYPKIKINKYRALENGEADTGYGMLQGARFTLKVKDGGYIKHGSNWNYATGYGEIDDSCYTNITEIDKLTDNEYKFLTTHSQSNGINLSGLRPGVYEVEEVVAPTAENSGDGKNYLLSENNVAEFTISEDGKVTPEHLDFVNKPDEPDTPPPSGGPGAVLHIRKGGYDEEVVTEEKTDVLEFYDAGSDRRIAGQTITTVNKDIVLGTYNITKAKVIKILPEDAWELRRAFVQTAHDVHQILYEGPHHRDDYGPLATSAAYPGTAARLRQVGFGQLAASLGGSIPYTCSYYVGYTMEQFNLNSRKHRFPLTEKSNRLFIQLYNSR